MKTCIDKEYKEAEVEYSGQGRNGRKGKERETLGMDYVQREGERERGHEGGAGREVR